MFIKFSPSLLSDRKMNRTVRLIAGHHYRSSEWKLSLCQCLPALIQSATTRLSADNNDYIVLSLQLYLHNPQCSQALLATGDWLTFLVELGLAGCMAMGLQEKAIIL